MPKLPARLLWSLCLIAALSRDASAGAARTQPASAGDEAVNAELQRAVNRVYPALVRIDVVYEEGQDGRMRKNRARGSGTIITRDGYVLTNHHVAGRATRITCRLSNREELDARLIGTDPLCDLAILKLDLSSRRKPNEPLPFAEFGDSDSLKIGDVVLAMGSPSGLSQSVTKGIVANTAMIMPVPNDFLLDGENVGELVRWIGHDAVIYHGNSGGPLVNLRGEIVGINEIGIATMGGAIPGNLAKAAARELIAHGSIPRSWTGLELQPLLKETPDARGILVSAVFPDSPAKAAGIEPGDYLTQIEGKTIAESRAPEDVPPVNWLLMSHPVGAKLALKGIHAGSPRAWSLVTVARERNQAKEVEISEWGLTVRDFTQVSALENHRPNRLGVQIDSVRSGGPGEAAKPALKPGDILLQVKGHKITNAQDLAAFTRSFVQGLSEPKPALVTLERDSRELQAVIKLGPEIASAPPGRAKRAWLGVETQVLTRELAAELGLEGRKGVRVTQVISNSPAQKSGLRTGDVLLKLDGRVISASTQADEDLFQNLIYEYKSGSEIELSGVRGGENFSCKPSLGDPPTPEAELAELKEDQFQFKARELSFRDRLNESVPADFKGLRVVTVERAGWAALSGLNPGDLLLSVAGQPVDSIPALKAVLAQLRDTRPRRVVFFVQRGIHTHFLEVEPRW
jgi:serine protease Do